MKNFFLKKNLDEESSSVSLSVEGNLPSWLEGSLIRNGPVSFSIDGKKVPHWFDGLAMLHAFSFSQGKVFYSNRFLRTDAYNKVCKEGSIHYTGFAVDPCRSIFKRMLSFFISDQKKEIKNANINVAKYADQFVALTETPLPVRFDPRTLETLGVLDYEDHLAKEKCWESAHPHLDTKSGDSINYLIEYGKFSHYVFYEIKNGTKKRRVLAKIPTKTPSYMHSFSLTENYLLLTEYPLVVNPLDFLLKGKPFIENFSWKKELGTKIQLIERKTGKVIKTNHTDSFFAFHHVNAFEKENKIFFDLIVYSDVKIIEGLADYDEEKEKTVFSSRLKRFVTSLDTDQVESFSLFEQNIEFPRIHPGKDGKAYQYAYGVEANNWSSSIKSYPIYKIDVGSKQFLSWEEKGCYPGEAVFVPHPQGEKEDDGVVLSIILDKKNQASFLLILDAKNLQELAKVKAEHQIPPGLHGMFFHK